MSFWALQRASVLLLAVLAASAPARAQEQFAGQFVVTEASSELHDETWYINANIDLGLSPEAVDMLRAPVPLTIRIEAQFLNLLRFWWDLTEFEAVVQYRVTYLPVRNRYQVRNLDTGRTQNFIDLDEALDCIGQVDRLAVAADSELDADRRYEVRVRAVLDKRDLPGPLRVIAFWRKDWSIASDWLTWRLGEE